VRVFTVPSQLTQACVHAQDVYWYKAWHPVDHERLLPYVGPSPSLLPLVNGWDKHSMNENKCILLPSLKTRSSFIYNSMY
jgi:hypothetical protein